MDIKIRVNEKNEQKQIKIKIWEKRLKRREKQEFDLSSAHFVSL
jgi:hypothetical protein